MASKHFNTHHAAAKQAHEAGDHSKALHHIGHLMNSVRSAMKAIPKTADEREALDSPAEEMAEQESPSSTPSPKPAFNRARFTGFKKS